jgi:hypothetical protein
MTVRGIIRISETQNGYDFIETGLFAFMEPDVIEHREDGAAARRHEVDRRDELG